MRLLRAGRAAGQPLRERGLRPERRSKRRNRMHEASSTMPLDPALDNECVNTLRFLSVDAVQKADSGHPGLPMGAAAMAYVLWTRFLKYNPANPGWFDRDRIV